MCGALVSIVIVVFSALFGLYQYRLAKSGSYVPIIQTQTKVNYYEDKVPLTQEEDNFQIAIAVSSFVDFGEQNTTRFIDLGNKFDMRLRIAGEENVVEPDFPISMVPCEDYSMFNLGEEKSLDARNEEFLQAHISANQFFCPKASDITLYGLKGDLKAKIMAIELNSETPTILEDTNLLIMTNNGRIDYDTDFLEPKVLRYTTFTWVPISGRNPTTSTFTLERQRLIKPQANYAKILGVDPETEDFFSLSKIVQTSPYSKQNDNPLVVASVEFQVGHDL